MPDPHSSVPCSGQGGKGKNELVSDTTSFFWPGSGRRGGAGWGQGWLGAGVGKGKNELVADTTSLLPGAAAGRGGGGVGGRVGKGKNELVSDTTSFLPVPRPF